MRTADGREVVSHAGASPLQGGPGVLVGFAIDDAQHQADDRAGRCTLVAHRRFTVTFGSRARLTLVGSVGSA